MLAVIGSMALLKHRKLNRVPSDWDLIGDYDELCEMFEELGASITPIDRGKKLVARNAFRIYEAEITWPDSLSLELYKLILSDPHTSYQTIAGREFAYASLDVLYMLKMTHRFKKNSPHFEKTLYDIQELRNAGAVIRDEHKDFYERRLKETLNYTHPKLNQSKSDFFTDSVPYTYDHDSIHRAVAICPQPAYTYYKPDQSEVFCSREMFEAQPKHIRLLGVYEEACVLALERCLIPYPTAEPYDAFKKALEKVCTSITSGWFREFAWENYDNVWAIYHELYRTGHGYRRKFFKGLADGTIKPYKGN